MTLESYLLAAPKAELHVHLEGSIMPETLLRLARRNHVALPADDIRGLSEWFRFRDFAHFVEVYVGIARCLKTVEDYELIAYEFGAAMARQNVRYSEVTTTPSMHRNLGIPFATYFDGLTRGRERAAREFGVEIAWIFDIVRGGPDAARLLAGADYATSAAIEHQRDGVIALGLAGMESGFPPEPFAPWFERARTAGLHCIPHAGEHAGPASIWGALHALGAERIAHGVRAIEDAELVEYLAQQRIAL